MSIDVRPHLEALERELAALLTPPDEGVAPLYGMMRYHMGWVDEAFRPMDAPGGKRVRPLLTLLACEAVCGDWERALPAASAIELIHNFSLLHDDIEDASETRRHRATAWTIWGVAQALNTGDAMWAISRLAAHRLCTAGHSDATTLRVFRLLDETCLHLCTGQYLDIHFESVDAVSTEAYGRMICGKTAALLSAAPAAGAILGGAGDQVVAEFAAFGRELGLTFQIVDDLLGCWGDADVTGKSAATDILTRKKTLPVVYARRWEEERGLTDLAELYARERLAPEDVERVLALLDRAGARAYAEERARAHQEATLAHLRATGLTHPAVDAIEELTLALLARSS